MEKINFSLIHNNRVFFDGQGQNLRFVFLFSAAGSTEARHANLSAHNLKILISGYLILYALYLKIGELLHPATTKAYKVVML